ncbi:MAG: hypothetical protein K2M29_02790 [Paramuribaculum sp.]|nr:hypothetical protein [Paramuribaculum sp.]
MNQYEDIINLPYPATHKRRAMSMANRAAQFAPFAALPQRHASSNSKDYTIEIRKLAAPSYHG